jgi:CheY-like chemotaxis protein
MPAGLILVVEDDVFLRVNLALLLEDKGYSTLEASSADEAIAILEARNDIRIVFTDVQMPGSMDGLKLSHAVSKKWPPIKIIVTSGRAFPLIDLPEGAIFLPKPYDSASVRREVELLLGS